MQYARIFCRGRINMFTGIIEAIGSIFRSLSPKGGDVRVRVATGNWIYPTLNLATVLR